MPIRTKRVYESQGPDDGMRILVDRLWPRGFAKATAPWDYWMKQVSPSDHLRRQVRAFSEAGRAEAWSAFVSAYEEELADSPEAVTELCDMAREGTVTLLFAAKDVECNNAVALARYLERRIAGAGVTTDTQTTTGASGHRRPPKDTQ